MRAAAARGPRPFWEREGLGELREAAEALEKNRSMARPGLADVAGKWRLVWTTGEGGKKGDGMYFPVKAEQSFCSDSKKLRNGVYAGPLAFYFDGPLRYSDKRSILEFTFDTASLALGPLGPFSFDAGGPEWDPEAVAPTAKGPFFRFLHADDACLVARSGTPRPWPLQPRGPSSDSCMPTTPALWPGVGPRGRGPYSQGALLQIPACRRRLPCGPEWDPEAVAPTAKGPFFRFLHAD